MVFSLVGSRKERRREEKEIEGGGFVLLISFKKKEIWSKYGKMLAAVNPDGEYMTSVVSFWYSYVFHKLT